MYDPSQHHRRSIRLKDYDYSQPGAYFVTISTQDRQPVLGTVLSGTMELSAPGKIAADFWSVVPGHFTNIESDTFVVMPNHLHVILIVTRHNGEKVETETQLQKSRTGSLGQVIAFYKYQTTKLINALSDTPGRRFWQKNYYEHVIRNDKDLRLAREYIENNPLKWELDRENPSFRRKQ